MSIWGIIYSLLDGGLYGTGLLMYLLILILLGMIYGQFITSYQNGRWVTSAVILGMAYLWYQGWLWQYLFQTSGILAFLSLPFMVQILV